MNNDVLVFGAGQVAQVFAAYLDENHYRVAAFVVDAKFWEPGVFIDGAPIVTFENLSMTYPSHKYSFVIGMSFKGLNAPRAEKFEAMKAKGYRPLTFVDRRATVHSKAKVGAGSFIMDLNNIQPFVEIGENVVGWSGSHWGHHAKVGNHAFVTSHVVISGAVEIGDYSFLGVGATLRDNVKVGKRCVIGAEALILSDCADDGVYSPGGTERASVPSTRLRGI